MSTPAAIYLHLHSSVKGTERKVNITQLPKAIIGGYEFPKVEVGDFEKIGIYHHWDGYPEDLGLFLYNHLKTHSDVLNFICGGSISTALNSIGIRYYRSWRNEDWVDCQPRQTNSNLLTEKYPYMDSHYTYLFRNGRWFVKDNEHQSWVDLEDYLVKEGLIDSKECVARNIADFVGKGGLCPFEHGFKQPYIKGYRVWGVTDTELCTMGKKRRIALTELSRNELIKILNTLDEYVRYCKYEA